MACSSAQFLTHGGQFGGSHAQRLGSRYKIGFVRAKEIDHRAQHCTIAQPFTQAVGRQPGQRQKPRCPVLVTQHPAKGGQGKRLRIDVGG